MTEQFAFLGFELPTQCVGPGYGYQGLAFGWLDCASHVIPVDRMSPLILSFPFMLPISPAQLEPIGMTFATGMPRLVMTRPSAPKSSSRLRHCSLNLEALMNFEALIR